MVCPRNNGDGFPAVEGRVKMASTPPRPALTSPLNRFSSRVFLTVTLCLRSHGLAGGQRLGHGRHRTRWNLGPDFRVFDIIKRDQRITDTHSFSGALCTCVMTPSNGALIRVRARSSSANSLTPGHEGAWPLI